MRLVIIGLVGLLLLPLVLGAQLQGIIYDEDLRPATNILLTVNTTPEQRLLSTQGSYVFNLAPGSYRITARYAHQGAEFLMIEEVTIDQPGAFTFDLFLFPELDEEIDVPSFPEPEDFVNETVPPSIVSGETTVGYWGVLFRFLGVTAFFVIVFLLYKMVYLRTKKVFSDSDPLEKQLVSLLKKNNNRMTQKNIRKHFAHSEATISLLLSELEEKNVIEKIKKGRTNIIKLK